MTQLAAAAAVVLVLAGAAVTWWLVGDQSTTTPDNADYVMRQPFRPSADAERAIGTWSLLAGVAAALWLGWASVGHGFYPSWWSVVGPLLLLGILAGLGWRVWTAGVIGANIGAGLFTFFVGPVILALLGWVIFRTIDLVD